MTKELMDKYKAGELNRRAYYCKNKNLDDVIVYTYFELDDPFFKDKIVDILAPVPSYEEWADLQAKLAEHKKLLLLYGERGFTAQNR